MIIMSHLSDIQDVALCDSEINHKINFAKFLLLKYPNTDTEVDADEEYSQFKQKHPEL